MSLSKLRALQIGSVLHCVSVHKETPNRLLETLLIKIIKMGFPKNKLHLQINDFPSPWQKSMELLSLKTALFYTFLIGDHPIWGLQGVPEICTSWVQICTSFCLPLRQVKKQFQRTSATELKQTLLFHPQSCTIYSTNCHRHRLNTEGRLKLFPWSTDTALGNL